ncbi:MAG: GNAT family N-acetyltransferase [Actinobacteria bacterium]|uniref:Unannotated protein n=1 Tax=freshwater metagenome TaxID=449393 RepID=A0A6J6P2K4_9ZZZZ|nr:GNAT family N-acetyltransferase [Actinomycetota bacterium]
MSDVHIRPMQPGDLEAAERLSSDSFLELDRSTFPPAWPTPSGRGEAHRLDWVRRTSHFLTTDPGGCWVAEDESGMVGFATSLAREDIWILATYAVRPGSQGRGIGSRLLDAAEEHGRDCRRAMLSSSVDPKAVRRYRLAGFSLHPQMFLAGALDRSLVPAVRGVEEGDGSDLDLLHAVDRHTRGASHGPDHELLSATCRLLVVQEGERAGYAYADHAGRLQLLAATDAPTATRLLWTVLADGPDEARVGHVTHANEWAVDVAIAARLDVWTFGYLGLRHMAPPAPYLHSGAML